MGDYLGIAIAIVIIFFILAALNGYNAYRAYQMNKLPPSSSLLGGGLPSWSDIRKSQFVEHYYPSKPGFVSSILLMVIDLIGVGLSITMAVGLS